MNIPNLIFIMVNALGDQNFAQKIISRILKTFQKPVTIFLNFTLCYFSPQNFFTNTLSVSSCFDPFYNTCLKTLYNCSENNQHQEVGLFCCFKLLNVN